MSSIEGSPTGRIQGLKFYRDAAMGKTQVIDFEPDAKFGEIIDEQVMLPLVEADFSEIERRIMAAAQEVRDMEEMKRMMLPLGPGEMLAEQMAEQRERVRWGNTPKTKPPERFTWKDKDPGRAKAKAARKQNRKRRQK